MKRIIGLSLVILFAMPQSFGGGSFGFEEELLPLLRKKSELSQYLLNSLEFSRVGAATRIGPRVNESLGGKRVGPYIIDAKPKGSKGPFVFSVTIKTDIKYFDEKGKACDLDNAVRLEENVAAVQIERQSQPPESK